MKKLSGWHLQGTFGNWNWLDDCRTFDTCPPFPAIVLAFRPHWPPPYPRFPVEPRGFHEFVRLSLMKAAHAVKDGACCRKSGISLSFSFRLSLTQESRFVLGSEQLRFAESRMWRKHA
jgi:hypothetical protein